VATLGKLQRYRAVAAADVEDSRVAREIIGEV
jgi:hypothetical protein